MKLNTDSDIIWAVIVEHPMGKGIATTMSEQFGPMPLIANHEDSLLAFLREEAIKLTRETGYTHTLCRYVRSHDH